MNSAKVLVLLVGFITVMLSLSLVIYVPSTTAYSPYNPGDLGLSLFKERYSPDVVYSDPDLDNYDTVVLLLDGELENVSMYVDFVAGGGRLIILDDEGYSNPLLSHMGLGMTVLNMCVLDEVYKVGDRLRVRGNLTVGDYRVGFFKPCYLEVGAEGEVLAYSSIFSYVDLDGDGNYTVGEPIGPKPLMARAGYGAGEVVVIGDKEFITNLFLARDINTGFLDEYLVGRVALDLRYTGYSSVDLVKDALEDMGAFGGGLVYGSVLIFLLVVGVIVYGELEKA